MQTFKMGGLGKISGGEYDEIRLEGVSSCSNDIKAESIYIEGVFSCSGEIETGTLYCEGVCDFKADIRAKKITVEGVFNEKEGTKIEAEEIICEGVIRTGGDIYVDVLRAEGVISAKGIYGDRIRIDTHHTINRIKKFFTMKSEIKLIEATTIELCGVSVDTVNGSDISIGENCRINKVDCSGTLFIDKSASVGSIIGTYTRKEY